MTQDGKVHEGLSERPATGWTGVHRLAWSAILDAGATVGEADNLVPIIVGMVEATATAVQREQSTAIARLREGNETAIARAEHAEGFLRDLSFELFEPEQMDGYRANPALIIQAAKNVNANEAHYRTRCEALEAEVTRLREERDRLRTALVKVRAHTSYLPQQEPPLALLQGLLATIERITEAALSSPSASEKSPKAV